MHHEPIGRNEGFSTEQLHVIRDTKTPFPPLKTIFTPLQTAAIAFTDHSTRNVRVPMDVIQELKGQLKLFVVGSGNPSTSSEDVDAKVDDLFVEAAMVVAAYNMVSRFLHATDVAGLSDMEVPWPVDKKEVSILFDASFISHQPLFMTRLIMALRSQTDECYILFVNFFLEHYLNYQSH